MESKGFLSSIPTGAWLVAGIFVAILVWWTFDDIGSWWETRQQAKFDGIIAEKQIEIDNLTKQRDAAIIKAEEAEAREQGKALEADLLRQEAAKFGVNIAEAQKRIEQATQTYSTDLDFLEKVKSGEISKLQLCEKQCTDSATLGYPCRLNYCAQFK